MFKYLRNLCSITKASSEATKTRAAPLKTSISIMSTPDTPANGAQKPNQSTKVNKIIVTSPDIYKPVGPYSQAILADKTLYVSGVLGLDANGQMACADAEGQTRQVLENLSRVLAAGGASLASVVKTTILLANIDDFAVVNKVYSEYFTSNFPARATYQVGKLPLGAAVEIEAVALSGDLVISEAGPCPCAKS